MAAITTYGLVGPLTKIPPSVQFSTHIDDFAPVDNSPPVQQYDQSVTGYGVITNNLPISEVAQNFAAAKAPSFLDDYYYRVHIRPGIIDLGNLLSVQVRSVEVWSAHFQPNLLSSITDLGTAGLTLSEPQLTPTSFGSLEYRLYLLNVSTSGPPVINGVFVFNFESENPTLSVLGRRVVIWPYRPVYPLSESLEWFTDIQQSFNREQRIRLRNAPRQLISQKSILSDADFSKAKAIAYQWVHRVFGVPVWLDMLYVGDLAIGAQSIVVDSSNTDIRAFDIVLIWSSNSIFQAVETTTVSASQIDLALPLSKNFQNAFVVPIRYANTLKGINFTRNSDAIISCDAEFTVRNNIDLSADVGLPSYKGLQVLIDTQVSTGSVSDKYSRSIDVFDNDSGLIAIDIKSDYVDIRTKVSIKAFGRANAWRYRQFIHSLYGRQKTFFLPSWHDEFEVLIDIGSLSTSITVKSIGYSLYYDNQFLLLQTKTGAFHFNRILSSSVNSDGDEVLNLESQFGVDIAFIDVKHCCLLKHVRSDTDKISFNHEVADHFSCNFIAKETPYVV